MVFVFNDFGDQTQGLGILENALTTEQYAPHPHWEIF